LTLPTAGCIRTTDIPVGVVLVGLGVWMCIHIRPTFLLRGLGSLPPPPLLPLYGWMPVTGVWSVRAVDRASVWVQRLRTHPFPVHLPGCKRHHATHAWDHRTASLHLDYWYVVCPPPPFARPMLTRLSLRSSNGRRGCQTLARALSQHDTAPLPLPQPLPLPLPPTQARLNGW
jgi:hypothetical protein